MADGGSGWGKLIVRDCNMWTFILDMLMDVASQERREKSLCFDAGSLDWRTDGLSVCVYGPV